jgi:hypothetical protein
MTTDVGSDLTAGDWHAIVVALVARLLPHGGEVCVVPEDFMAVADRVLSVKVEMGSEAQASITLSLEAPRLVVGEAVSRALGKGRLQ